MGSMNESLTSAPGDCVFVAISYSMRATSMNKAFLREPDPVDSRCPRCDSAGHPVGPETLTVHLAADIRKGLADSAYFCPTSSCPVVYYDDFGALVRREALTGPIPVKDPDAPLCACFGLTREDIDQDLEEGTVARTRAAVQQAQSPAARCVTQAPNGRSCVAEIQKYYFKQRSQESP